jgi:hypothetical protein
LRLGQPMWDLWWEKWHWDRLFSEFFGFPLSMSFHRGSSYSYIIWGMNNMPVGGRSSETSSHPIDMNKNNKRTRISASSQLSYRAVGSCTAHQRISYDVWKANVRHRVLKSPLLVLILSNFSPHYRTVFLEDLF